VELKRQLANQVRRLLGEVEQVGEQMANLFERPFKAISFDLGNEQYEQYEAKEVIYSDALPTLNKVLR